MKKIAPLSAIALLILSSAGYTSAGTPTDMQICEVCHGQKGVGYDGFSPKLTGLSQEYIIRQLELFQTKKRVSHEMNAISQLINTPERKQTVGAYFSSATVTPEKTVTAEMKNDNNEVAVNLILQGDPARNMQACGSCHNPSGSASGLYPRLAGQYEIYLSSQLKAWQTGDRTGDADNAMKNVAVKLTSDEIKALASFYSKL